MTKKGKRRLLIFICILVVFFIGYSFVFRTFIDPDRYLEVAWEYTGQDPHILDWQMPEAELIWRDRRPLIHVVYHTDQDRELGPYSFYIDPFKMEVVDEDPRR